MKVWTCIDFDGYNPVGTSAVVVAESVEVALIKIVECLEKSGLTGLKAKKAITFEDLIPLPVEGARLVRILNDGDY